MEVHPLFSYFFSLKISLWTSTLMERLYSSVFHVESHFSKIEKELCTSTEVLMNVWNVCCRWSCPHSHRHSMCYWSMVRQYSSCYLFWNIWPAQQLFVHCWIAGFLMQELLWTKLFVWYSHDFVMLQLCDPFYLVIFLDKGKLMQNYDHAVLTWIYTYQHFWGPSMLV